MIEFATPEIKLCGMKDTLDRVIDKSHELGIFSNEDVVEYKHDIATTIIPELCNKYSMDIVILKLDKLRDEISEGCSPYNSYVRMEYPEKIEEFNNIRKSLQHEFVAQDVRLNKEHREYVLDSVYDNAVKVQESD